MAFVKQHNTDGIIIEDDKTSARMRQQPQLGQAMKGRQGKSEMVCEQACTFIICFTYLN